MKIYKKAQLIRMAGELLCKDFQENKDFVFTNSSYSSRNGGDVLGTIVKDDRNDHSETHIHYLLKTNWHTEETVLARYFDKTEYKTNSRDYNKIEEETPILKVFKVADGVYVDDEEYSAKALEIRNSRYSHRGERHYSTGIEGSHNVKFGTKLYEKLFNEISRIKPIKYGSPLSIYVYRTTRSQYIRDEQDNYVKRDIAVIETSVCYTYRGREYTVHHDRSAYDLATLKNIKNF